MFPCLEFCALFFSRWLFQASYQFLTGGEMISILRHSFSSNSVGNCTSIQSSITFYFSCITFSPCILCGVDDSSGPVFVSKKSYPILSYFRNPSQVHLPRQKQKLLYSSRWTVLFAQQITKKKLCGPLLGIGFSCIKPAYCTTKRRQFTIYL